jgi:serine/threonine-protein kinase
LPSLAGQSLDKYDMLDEVGHGGMAVVDRGRDNMLDREVAVKVLHPHLAGREESRLRLRREALTVAKLRHENIVEIYDYSGPEADESYIVTEFIHGETLRDWLDARWTPHPVLASLVVHRLCLALQHAHELGIVHRDIKPENVMIRSDGCLKLMDFGIAQILDAQKLTMTGQLLGSPAYMAPELISGKPIDKRTDLFACGVLLYQLATGELPFSGRNPHEVLHRISDGEYSNPQAICSKVDDGLVELIAQALTTEPDDRFESARAMANAIEDYLLRFDIQAAEYDLAAFFRDPDAALDRLDQELCATLLEKARNEARDGHRARALGMLGQVLEFDPENKDALSLVDTVKARGRRTQTLLFGGLALAVAGFVAAGVVLIRAEAPSENTIAAGPEATSAQRPNKYTIPSSGNPRPDREPGKPTPTATGPESAASDVPTRTPGRATPRPIVKATPAGDRFVECQVTVKGLPAVQRSKYKLAADKQARPLEGDGAKLLVDRKKSVMVRLKGSGQFYGQKRLSAEQCARGPVELTARPRPRKVQFAIKGVSIAPDRLTLRCEENCWADHKRRSTKTANERFEFRSPDGIATEWKVTVLANGSGVKKNQRISFTVRSGTGDAPQRVTLKLEPI